MAAELLLVLAAALLPPAAPQQGCGGVATSFEVVTGFVFRADNATLELQPGTLQLTECLGACRGSAECRAVNFETGLCVLFSTSARELPDALVASHLPVFTVYAHKICLPPGAACGREWSFERVPGWELSGRTRRSASGVASAEACMGLCLGERGFECRSATFRRRLAQCHLSDADRHSLHDDLRGHFLPAGDDADYLESNCVDLGERLCEFRALAGRILKTADAVFQEVQGLEECRRRCLRAPFRCHSFDLGYPQSAVCRLSHLASNALLSASDLYLEAAGTATYEAAACYNVSVQCKSREMVAEVRSSRLFDGKVYARSRPNSCVTDVRSELRFRIRMAYHDLDCDVRHQESGEFSNDLVIQHHDRIVTNQDMGVTVRCQYDLANRSVAHGVRFLVNSSELEPLGSRSVSVGAPNVTMSVVDRAGRELASARVGDPLLLRFTIRDPDSPYDVLVRELVAMDGIDSSEILLIDALGCPTDPLVMGPVTRSAGRRQTLEVAFDAFKFPTTDVVQFKALLTPCLPACEPAECLVGGGRSVSSRGRRRRRNTLEGEEVLVVRAIRIQDTFGFQSRTARDDVPLAETDSTGPNQSACLDVSGLVVASSLFLVAQLAVLLAWAFVWRRPLNTAAGEGIDNPCGGSLHTRY